MFSLNPHNCENSLFISNYNKQRELDRLSPEYPGEFLVHVTINDQCHSSEKIAEANNTITIPIETIEQDLRISGRIS